MNQLGEGSYGSVSMQDYKGKLVATKTFKSEASYSSIIREVYPLTSCYHPNIIHGDLEITPSGDVYLHMPLAMTSLQKIFSSIQNPSSHIDPDLDLLLLNYKSNQDLKITILWDLLQAIHFIHTELHLIHADIKADNLVVFKTSDDEYLFKLIDFGISVLAYDGSALSDDLKYTLGYRAPEVERGIVSFKSDIYAFGVIALQLFVDRNIYEINQQGEYIVKQSVFSKRNIQARIDVTYNRNPKLRDQLKAIILSCLSDDPNERPTAFDLLNMDLFVNKGQIAQGYAIEPALLTLSINLADNFYDRNYLAQQFIYNENHNDNSDSGYPFVYSSLFGVKNVVNPNFLNIIEKLQIPTSIYSQITHSIIQSGETNVDELNEQLQEKIIQHGEKVSTYQEPKLLTIITS